MSNLVISRACDLVVALAKATGKHYVYLSWTPDDDWREVVKAAPCLSLDDVKYNTDCIAAIECVDYGDGRRVFDLVVGDDGPTESNKYDGPVAVFACLIGPNGGITENT